MLPFFPTMPGPWDGAGRSGAYPSRFNLPAPFQELDMLMLRGSTMYDQHQELFAEDIEAGHPWGVDYLLPMKYGSRNHGVEAMGAVSMSRDRLKELRQQARGVAPPPPPMPAEPAYPYAVPRTAAPSPYGIKELPYDPGVGVPFQLEYQAELVRQMPATEGAVDVAREEMARIAQASDAAIPSQPFETIAYPWWYR